MPELVKGLFDKLFGDKGYVSLPLFETLYDEGVQLVTVLVQIAETERTSVSHT